MKILVFDDSLIHREAAKAQLKGHDLTVVGTYDEAQKLLKPQTDTTRAKQIFASRYGDSSPYKSEGLSEGLRKERMVFYDEAEKSATIHPNFDAVLTDLLVPASGQAQGGEGQPFVGTEMPVGIFIALLAIQNGMKRVAVLTDKNHHDHPASACLDAFGGNFPIGGDSRILLSNKGPMIGQFDPKDLGRRLEYQECWSRKDMGKEVVQAKDWAKLLDVLMKD